ncbi:hypothetical protein AgCh_020827 [Apium graveolens]
MVAFSDYHLQHGVSISNTEYVLIPVCDQHHFIVFIFDIANWELLLLDPFPYPSERLHDKAANFVTMALNHILKMKAPDRFKAIAPKFYIPSDIPKQLNGHDCGVLVCKYMDAFAQGLDIGKMSWNQDELDSFRYRIVKELVIKRRCRNMFSKSSDAPRRTEHVVSGEDGPEGNRKEDARKKDNGDKF